MIALKITDIGGFMNRLMKNGLFDHFLLQEAVITREISCTIDGTVNRDYYSEEERETLNLKDSPFLPFSILRPLCFELLKGKKKPVFFRFVFLLSPQNQANTVSRCGGGFRNDDIRAMYLNLTYKNNTLTCTTGISCRTFSLDRTLEREWDRLVGIFFRQHGIETEPAG